MLATDFHRFLVADSRLCGGTALSKVRQVSYRMSKAKPIGSAFEDTHSFPIVLKSSISVIEVPLYLSQPGEQTCYEQRISRIATQSNRLRKNLFPLFWAAFFPNPVA